MINKNITPLNDKGQKHGHYEWYYRHNGLLSAKGKFINDKEVGYWEDYYSNGGLFSKTYYIL